MRRILSTAVLLVVALAAMGQERIIQTTPTTRAFLRATNEAQARALLGFATTNTTSLTNLPGGSVDTTMILTNTILEANIAGATWAVMTNQIPTTNGSGYGLLSLEGVLATNYAGNAAGLTNLPWASVNDNTVPTNVLHTTLTNRITAATNALYGTLTNLITIGTNDTHTTLKSYSDAATNALHLTLTNRITVATNDTHTTLKAYADAATNALSGVVAATYLPLAGGTVTGSVTATNFVTSAVKWIDIPMVYGYSTLGPNAPALTPVSAGSVIQELAFDNSDILYAQGQFQHNVATTNAAFPDFYFEPHVHFTTVGTLDATHSNVTWRCEWELGKIGGTWVKGTNTVTTGVAANDTHYMSELGHITNNAVPHLSTIFRCRLMRPASVAQDYSNAHDVLLDALDLHIPVGNVNAIGSGADNSP